jgi:hypothetical protein
MSQTEKICGNCALFRVEAPTPTTKMRNFLDALDIEDNPLNQLYGRRTCSAVGSGTAAQECRVPNEFQDYGTIHLSVWKPTK